MAAISALADYGSDSNESEGDREPEEEVTEEMLLHLKPMGRVEKETSLKSDMQIMAAPQIVTKVNSKLVFGHHLCFTQKKPN